MPEAKLASNPEKQRRLRIPAENRYPVYDLDSCLQMARAVQEQGGNACNPQQLGAFLNYTNTSGGGFVARVAAARQFGLITTVNGLYQTTARAQAILYPVTRETAQAALVEAFLSVPLYRQIYDRHKGARLPEEFGMRNLLVTQYHVPSGERAARAYKVMMDTAAQAGFFTATRGQRSHLIEPVLGSVEVSAPTTLAPSGSGGDDGGNRHDGNGGASASNQLAHLHPMLRGLLLEIPPQGQPWPDRDKWEAAWQSTVNYLYPMEGQGAPVRWRSDVMERLQTGNYPAADPTMHH